MFITTSLNLVMKNTYEKVHQHATQSISITVVFSVLHGAAPFI